ncbi:MAG TPA: hypothetical protein DCM45_03750 [Clostridiales bacterium]|nr:hypothetical protein [Clostridiales bacterium]
MRLLIRNLKVALLLFLALSLALLTGLVIQQNRSRNELFAAAGENKAALKSRYANAGTIVDRNGVVLAESIDGQRTYSRDKGVARAVLHLVGDYTHNIDNTIEARYQANLLGSGRNLLHQLILDLSGHGLAGDNITLAIDSALSERAYDLLDGRRGSVVIINYQTGAVLTAVSSPSTSPASVIAYKDIPDTALFNRALQGAYAPGSTFKILTAAAWLESSNFDSEYSVDCQGQSTVSADGADESGDGHGKVDLTEAFAESCNVYFGELGVKMGNRSLLAIADDFGLTSPLTLGRLDVRTGIISGTDDPTALSWLSIGQPSGETTLQMTPLQMAMMAGAIANEGQMMQPWLVDHLTDPAGRDFQNAKPTVLRTVASRQICEQLETLMISVTENGTGRPAAVKGLAIAGKTGTVQVEGKKNNALYVGYIVDEKSPYAIAVVIEEGGSGREAAAPIAGKLLKMVSSLQE